MHHPHVGNEQTRCVNGVVPYAYGIHGIEADPNARVSNTIDEFGDLRRRKVPVILHDDPEPKVASTHVSSETPSTPSLTAPAMMLEPPFCNRTPGSTSPGRNRPSILWYE